MMNRVVIVLAGLLVTAASGGVSGGPPAMIEELTLPAAPAAPWRFEGFPIIAWWPPPGTAPQSAFDAYRDAGFTLYLANPDRGFYDGIDKAANAGLNVLVSRQTQGFGQPGLGRAVDWPFDRPEVVGWLTFDEPNSTAAAADSIRAVNELMRRDADRRALFNMLPPFAQTDPTPERLINAAVRNGVPILSFDQYVLRPAGDEERRFYDALELYRRKSLEHDVPFWAFALTVEHFGYRAPSESDLRWQHYANLAYGAKGLWYFTYWAPEGWKGWSPEAIVTSRGESTPLYDQVRRLNHNVLAMGETLLALENQGVWHTRPLQGHAGFETGRNWIAGVKAQAALVSHFRHADGSEYALLVNTLHGADKTPAETADNIEVTFANDVRSVRAVNWLDGEIGPLPLQSGKASLTIAGGTGVLLRREEERAAP